MRAKHRPTNQKKMQAVNACSTENADDMAGLFPCQRTVRKCTEKKAVRGSVVG